MSTYSVKFLNLNFTEDVEAQEVVLMGHESEWTDFIQGTNTLIRRLRSVDIERIDLKQ